LGLPQLAEAAECAHSEDFSAMKRVRLPDTLPQMRFLGVAHEAAPWVTELWRQEQACPVTIIQVKNGAEAERWAALLETLQGLAFSAQRRSEIWLLPPPPQSRPGVRSARPAVGSRIPASARAG